MRISNGKTVICSHNLPLDNMEYVDVPSYGGATVYRDDEFKNLINIRNQVVFIKPYGNFTIRCGHEPRTSDTATMIFLAWPIKAPPKYKSGLAIMCNDSTREKAISLIVRYLAGPV